VFELENSQLCRQNMKFFFCVVDIDFEKKWKMSLRAYTSNVFEVRSVARGDGMLG